MADHDPTLPVDLPTADPDGTRDAAAPPGRVIGGRYTLIRSIGEGGMGEVWAAEQTEPVRRVVAVKLIRADRDSKQVLARFEAERQALAVMDHPNIARVFDGGADADGRPYFVMELVRGKPITRYCDEKKLGVRERLALFVPVCLAIQHAHQKGIIHRDIKPANVLVGEADGRPVPKVIDFGVAKATAGPLTDLTLNTGYGALVGTPEYMAPEQADPSALDVDTRADVYALGSLLYELLAGGPPFRRTELATAGLLEMLRVVREVDPPRPSAKAASPDLARLLRRELDWVALKALEKDRNRRYDTPAALSADVTRFLTGEAVLAVPPTAGYRLRKWARRNRGAVVAGGLVAAALLAGTGVSTWQAVRATEAERKAVALAEAEATRRKEAEAVAGLVDKLFRQIDASQTDDDLRRVMLAEIDRILDAVDADYPGDPLTQARLRTTLGRTLLGMHESKRALAVLEKAFAQRREHLGDDHRDTNLTRSLLGVARWYNGQTTTALRMLESAAAAQRVDPGSDHPDTLWTLEHLLDLLAQFGREEESGRLAAECARRWQALRPPDDPDRLRAEALLGWWTVGPEHRGKGFATLEAALAAQRRTLGDDHPHALDTQMTLAEALLYYPQPDGAILVDKGLEQFRDYNRRAERVYGPDSQRLLTGRRRYALMLADQKRDKCPEALELLAAVRGVAVRKYDAGHAEVIATDLAVGRVHQMNRDPRQSIAVLVPALAAWDRLEVRDLSTTHECWTQLRQAYLDAGDFPRAVAAAERAVDILRPLYPATHPSLLRAEGRLADALFRNGEREKAFALTRRRAADSAEGTDERANALNQLCGFLTQLGRHAEAVEQAELSHAAVRACHPDDPAKAVNSLVQWELCLYRVGKIDDGLAKREQVRAIHRDLNRPLSGDTPLVEAGKQFAARKEHAEAEKLFRRAADDDRERAKGEYLRPAAAGLLGKALSDQGKHADAVAVLTDAYGYADGWGKTTADTRVHRLEVAKQLAAAYRAWGKEVDATEWERRAVPREVLPKPKEVKD